MITRRKLLIAAPALLIPKRAKAWTHGAASISNGLIINLLPTAAFLAAPLAFQAAVQTAANMHMAQWTNTPITVNIQIGYDEFSAGGATSFADAVFGKNVLYPTVRSSMQSIATASGNATIASVVSALPAGSTIGGFGSLGCARVTLKMFGISPDISSLPVAARDSVVDGQIGFGSSTPLGNMVGVALYEINHIMGRIFGPFYLTHFTASGTWEVNNHSFGSYFSVDGGVTNICYYDNSFDFSGFANNAVGSAPGSPTLPNDAFCWNFTTAAQTMSATDIQALNSIGYW